MKISDVPSSLSDALTLVGGVYLSYSDSYITDAALSDFLEQSAYTKVDARIGVESSDGAWGVSLIGNNLTDEAILNSSMVFIGNTGHLKSPRTVTLQGTYSF